MQFIKVKKFREYQHYHNRNIFWIKLHLQILDNLDFWYFEDWEKWLWIGLLMLAGKLENRIPYNEDFIRSKLAIRTQKPLKDTLNKFADKKMIEFTDECIDTSIDTSIAQIRGDKIREEKIYCQATPDCISVIEYLNLKANKSFSPKSKAVSFVKARLNEGRTVEILKRVIDLKVEQWLNDKVMSKYLRPLTLFNTVKFESYIQELSITKQEKPTKEQEQQLDERAAKMLEKRKVL